MGGSMGGSRGGSMGGATGSFHGGSSMGSSHGSSISGSTRGPSMHSGSSGFSNPTARSLGNPAFNMPHSATGPAHGLPNSNTLQGHRSPDFNHAIHSQTWSHGNAWWQQFDHGGHNWNNPHHYWPWYSPWLGNPFWYADWWGYGPYYQWNGYPYADCAAYYYPPAEAATPAYVAQERPASSVTPSDAPLGGEFLSSAQEAFHSGNFAQALRLASHAAVELPQNAQPHELMSLALFALKDYRGANIEAHAALALAPASDWNTLYAYYGEVPVYERQLEALVVHIDAHPDAADARFVLAYHDLMMGHKKEARAQLEIVVARVPQDQVAAKLLRQLGGTPPTAGGAPKSNSPAKPTDKAASGQKVL